MKTKTVKTKRAPVKDPWKKRELKALLAEVESIRSHLRNLDDDATQAIAKAHRNCRARVRNLLQSVAFRDETSRRPDLRDLNDRLEALGLARLGPWETAALAMVDAIRAILHRLRGQSVPQPSIDAIDHLDGRRLLERRSEVLLGTADAPESPKIFATLPVKAEGRADLTTTAPRRQNLTRHPASKQDLITELISAGTSGFYLTASRDSVENWRNCAEQVRLKAESLKRPQRLLVGLGSPQIETGELAQGAAVLRFEPRRNQLGKLLSPARLWLTSEDRNEAPLQPVEAILPVSTQLLHRMQTEDRVSFKDARGRRRALRIRGAGRSGCLAETDQTTYIEAGAALHLERRGKLIGKGHVGALPRIVRPLELFPGDPMILTREPLPGRPALSDGGFLRSPARISCTVPEVLDQVQAGERVVFGDGTLVGKVDSVTDEGLRILLLEARAQGSQLVSGVAIRFPDSALRVAAFDPGNVAPITFACKHADAVVLNGTERPEDVLALGRALDDRGGHEVAIVLGIESRRGVAALPRLLLAALRRSRAAILVSPNALALEYGPARLEEVLAEIRWLSRSAHLPLITASPALDRLARQESLHPADLQEAVSRAPVEGLLVGGGPSLPEVIRHFQAAESSRG